MGLQDEGTVGFWIDRPDHPDWDVNSASYHFGRLEMGQLGISAAAKKERDGRLSITISGPFSETFTFSEPLGPRPVRPSDFPKHLQTARMVLLRWNKGVVDLFIDGAQRAQLRVKPIRLQKGTIVIDKVGSGDVPMELVDRLIGAMSDLLGFFSAISGTTDPDQLSMILANDLDKAKIRFGNVEWGSAKIGLELPRKALRFALQHLKPILSILNGHTRRLADAYTRKQEAEAAISEEKAKQERFATLEKAAGAARALEGLFETLYPNLPPEQRNKLLSENWKDPNRLLGEALIDNQATLEIESENREDD